jgi:uncharacterized coiled-coil protein SlyX
LNKDRVEESLANLEAEQAFQGDAVRELSDALAAQQQDLILIKRQLALLAEQLRSLRESAQPGSLGDNEAQEKPPHY